MYLLEMAPKFLVALIILLIYVKLSGKSQIAPMSQLDQVGSMVIGALVGGTLLNANVSAWESAGAVAIWAGLLILVRFIKSKNSKLRDAIDETWLKHEIKKQGYKDIKDIFCAEWFDDKLLVYPYDEVRKAEHDNKK